MFASTAKNIGLQVVGGPEGMDPAASNYRALTQKVRQANPDLVYWGGITDHNGGKLWQDLRATLGATIKLMGPADAYEAVTVAITAIEKAGSKDRAAIRDAIFATRNYDGVFGTWSFTETGDTTASTMSVRQVKNGRWDDNTTQMGEGSSVEFARLATLFRIQWS